jgi:hypothetical protein
MRHIRIGIDKCSECSNTWARHTQAERKSTGLCMWYQIDSQTTCLLLDPCPLHGNRNAFGFAHWLDPNAPVRLHFIEDDYKNFLNDHPYDSEGDANIPCSSCNHSLPKHKIVSIEWIQRQEWNYGK